MHIKIKMSPELIYEPTYFKQIMQMNQHFERTRNNLQWLSLGIPKIS